jgi:hypothetical protein
MPPAEAVGRRVEARRAAAAAAAWGVPEIVKVEVVSVSALEVRPAGKPLTVQENGAVPPVTVMSHEKPAAIVAVVQESGSELEEGKANDDDAFPPPQPESAKTGNQESTNRKKSREATKENKLKTAESLLGFIASSEIRRNPRMLGRAHPREC